MSLDFILRLLIPLVQIKDFIIIFITSQELFKKLTGIFRIGNALLNSCQLLLKLLLLFFEGLEEGYDLLNLISLLIQLLALKF